MKKIVFLILITVCHFVKAQTFTNTTGGLISDNNQLNYFPLVVSGLNPSTINTSTFGIESVSININHTYDSDLEIKLQSPDGTQIVLSSANGASGDNFTNTVFTDSVANSIISGSAPFTGYYKPQNSFSTLNNGQIANGIWQLIIRDTYATDFGNVISWNIKFGNNPQHPLQVDSTNLPIVVINTNGLQIPEGTKITADMGTIYNGTNTLNYLTDTFNNYNGKIGIEIRGQSSTGFDQKQFNVETKDSIGNSLDASLLGMPIESDWVLYAPGNDKSLMRNVITYRLAREMGQWAPRTQFCEVMINGEYQGVYVLMEKIKRDKNRVDIKKLTTTANSGDSLTGGYIFKIDKDAPNFYSPIAPPNSTSGQSIGFSYQYPKPQDITTAQANYIQRFVIDSFETSLNSANFQDPINGYRKYVSVKSFVDFFIVNEISKNVDGYRLSSYFNKDRNSKGGQLKAGPVWDFNLAWHNADYCEGDLSSGWAYKFNDVCGGDNWVIPFWWDRFMQDSAFSNKLYCRWQELRGTLLDTTILFSKIDSITTQLATAQSRHFTRFPILGVYLWPNPSPLANTYAEEIIETKKWIVNRIAWLDANIPIAGACSPTAIQSHNDKLNSTVVPNPVNNLVSVSFTTPTPNFYEISIYSLTGEKLTILKKDYFNRGQFSFDFHLNNYGIKNGIYFLKISSDMFSETIKLVKL